MLKEASKYSSMIELSQSKIKEIPSDTNNNNTNTNIFEETPKVKSPKNKNDDGDNDNKNNKSKNLLLDDDDSEEEDNKEEKNKEKEEKEEAIPVIKQKEIIFDKNNINNSESSNTNIETSNPIKVYNKKKLQRQTSPKSSKDNIEINKSNINNQSDNGEQKEEINTENNKNEEIEESINPNFNLYKPTKEGLLTFNLSKKNYYTIVPENYSEFWKEFDPETSIQYNTLEGLFIVNSK